MDADSAQSNRENKFLVVFGSQEPQEMIFEYSFSFRVSKAIAAMDGDSAQSRLENFFGK